MKAYHERRHPAMEISRRHRGLLQRRSAATPVQGRALRHQVKMHSPGWREPRQTQVHPAPLLSVLTVVYQVAGRVGRGQDVTRPGNAVEGSGLAVLPSQCLLHQGIVS